MSYKDIFSNIKLIDEMMVANFFGIDVAPVSADPYEEWLVLPNDCGFTYPDNEERARKFMESAGMDEEAFIDFVSRVMHAVVDGKGETVINDFRPIFEKVINEYGVKVDQVH